MTPSDEVLAMNPEYAQLIGKDGKPMGTSPSKYGNVRTQACGMTFQSGKEALGVSTLILQEEARQIFALRLQVAFPLPGDTMYRADAVYCELQNGRLELVVLDIKPIDKKTGRFRYTKEYKLKKNLFEERYGIKITEI